MGEANRLIVDKNMSWEWVDISLQLHISLLSCYLSSQSIEIKYVVEFKGFMSN